MTRTDYKSINRNEITTRALTEEQELYKENIIDYYKNPRNKHMLKDYSYKHIEINPLCGDEITLYLKIENKKITQASFEGKGCAISQASISMLTEKLKDIPLQDAKKINKDDILAMLGIPISFVRLKCALLSLKALTKSLEAKT